MYIETTFSRPPETSRPFGSCSKAAMIVATVPKRKLDRRNDPLPNNLFYLVKVNVVSLVFVQFEDLEVGNWSSDCPPEVRL
jgi:hypothetical protein